MSMWRGCLLSLQVTRQQMPPLHDTSRVQSVCDRYIWCDIKSFPPDKGLQSQDTSSFLGVAERLIDGREGSPAFCLIIVRATAGNIRLHSPLSVFLSAQGPGNVIWGVWLYAFLFCVCVTHQEPSGQMTKTADVANNRLHSVDTVRAFSCWRITLNSLVNSSKPWTTKPTSLVLNHNIICKLRLHIIKKTKVFWLLWKDSFHEALKMM